MLTRPLRLALLTLLCACSKAPGGAAPGDGGARGALVVRVGQVELHEDDVQRAIARDPGAAGGRFESPAARSELIDGLVRFELLAQAAERAGLTKDPDAVHALQQIAVTKLVNRTLGALASPEAISKAEIEREYAAHQASDYTLPMAVQLRHIRVTDAALAERLAARARAFPAADDRSFAELASNASEDSGTRAGGGDLGFVDKSSHLPSALLEAALHMKAPGDVAGPIQTESGYEILRCVSVRAAAVSPLSSVEEQIRQRLYRERRAKALDDYIARLRAETPVQMAD